MFKYIMGFLLILLCFLNEAGAVDYVTLNKLYLSNIKQAQECEIKGDVNKAYSYYLKAEEIIPDRYEAGFGLAKTLGWQKKNESAQKYYLKLIKQAPDNIPLLESYAGFLRDNKNYKESVQLYQKLIKLTNQKKYQENIADIFYRQGDYKRAIELYQGIYDKNNTRILKALADSCFNVGKYNEALTAYSKYLSKCYDDKSYINYMKCLFYTGNNLTAKETIEDYLNKNPPVSDILDTLGDIYLSLNDFNKAEETFLNAVKLDPDNSNIKIKYVESLVALGKIEQAKEFYSELEAIDIKNAETLEILGDINTSSGNFDKALKYYLESYGINKNDNTNFKIAEVYRYKGNIQISKEYYSRLLNSDKYKVKAKLGLGLLQVQNGKLDKAGKVFNEVLSQDKDNYDAKFNLAKISLEKEDNLKAIKMLKSLNQNDEVNYSLAKAYYNINRNKNALDLLHNNSLKEAKELRETIQANNMLKIEPVFVMHRENGDINNNLSFMRYGGTISKYIKPNLEMQAGIVATPYSAKNSIAESTGTYYWTGLKGKPTDHLGFNSEIGIDSFSNGGVLVLGNFLLDITPTDRYKFNIGYIRSLVEESMLSAAGLTPSTGPFANRLVGRVTDNKFIANSSFKLPYSSYAYLGYNLGYKDGKNIPANLYQEIYTGAGKVLYSASKDKLINLISSGYNFYYSGYEDNRLGYHGASLEPDSLGSSVGGYFSPKFIFANNFALKIRGCYKRLKLKYSDEGHIGVQNIKESGTDMTWGSSIVTSFNEEGRVGLRLLYLVDFYGVTRQQNFSVNLIFRL